MAFPEEDIPLPLVRRASRPARSRSTEAGVDAIDEDDLDALEAKLAGRKRNLRATGRAPGERLRPASAGALTGALGGLAAFGSVMLLDPSLASRAFDAVTRLAPVPPGEAAVVTACAVAALGGAFVGALFAKLTRRLRRFLPMLTWSVVVFPSLVVALLAVQRTYLPRAHFLAPKPLLLASLAFAFVWSLAVLLRGRSGHDVPHEVA